MRDVTVLITACGNVYMPGTAASVKNNGERNIRLIGADMNHDDTILQMFDQYYQVPRGDDPSYADVILDICIKEHVDVVIPIMSVELETLAKNADRFAAAGVALSVSNLESLKIANNKLALLEEPYVKATIMSPSDYIGAIMELSRERRGEFINMEYMTPTRVMIVYDLPLSEIIYDFFDQLKSRTRGYASLDYELDGYRSSELVKMDILVNDQVVDALSVIVHKDVAYRRGRALVEKLRSLIPRQMFEIPVQAAVGGRVIARESVKAMRKDVLAKCYGGDITRKRKLLEKQKEGKKRMKQVGNVEIPQEAFMAVLEVKD